MSKPADAVTVVIPVYNSPEKLEAAAQSWAALLEKTGRDHEILIVDDASTDATTAVAAKLKGRFRHLRTLRHETHLGYGACLRTALGETRTPLFFYTAVDYRYAPADIRPLLERIELRDEILNKPPDLISGCRMGQPTPQAVVWLSYAWKVFWRLFAGLPITDANPWHGWSELFYRWRVSWVYAVPLVDVNSCFKLYRTAFLKRFPIQSDGDFVHTELVAKATFLTSIMDEVPLSPRPEPVPPLGPVGADKSRVFHEPAFTFPPQPTSAAPPALLPEAANVQPAPPEPQPPTVTEKSEEQSPQPTASEGQGT